MVDSLQNKCLATPCPQQKHARKSDGKHVVPSQEDLLQTVSLGRYKGRKALGINITGKKISQAFHMLGKVKKFIQMFIWKL